MHTQAGIVVSAQEHGLLPISQHAMRFTNAIGYHDYEGLALELDEQERLVKDLGPHKAKNTEWKAHLWMLDKMDPSYKT